MEAFKKNEYENNRDEILQKIKKVVFDKYEK